MCVIYRGHTHLFTARDQLVDEHRLTVLGKFKVFPQLLVLQTGQHDQPRIENVWLLLHYLLFCLRCPVRLPLR